MDRAAYYRDKANELRRIAAKGRYHLHDECVFLAEKYEALAENLERREGAAHERRREGRSGCRNAGVSAASEAGARARRRPPARPSEPAARGSR